MSMANKSIKSICAKQVYTTRGFPGIEAIIKTEGGIEARAVCSAGLSVGTHEIKFLYDGGTKWRGKGMLTAAKNVEEFIAPALIGADVTQQGEIDRKLVEFCKNNNVGGNAIAAVSAAVLKAGALTNDVPLYRYIGGVNANTLPVPSAPGVCGHDRYGGGITTPSKKPSITFVCYDFPTFSEASAAGWDIVQYWTEEIEKRGQGCTKDLYGFYDITEGCFKDDREIFELMEKTIHKAGYGGKVGIQADLAADTYYNKEDQKYYGLLTKEPKTRDEMMDLYINWIKNVPLVVLEDPFHEDDFESFAELTKATDIQIVGDDLFTTNIERVKRGVEIGAANTVLLKVNQVGTITDALNMVQFAYDCGYGVMPCESRGEGESIADYAVGINASSIREAALGMSGNRLIEIEKELGSSARFLGKKGLKGKRFQADN